MTKKITLLVYGGRDYSEGAAFNWLEQYAHTEIAYTLKLGYFEFKKLIHGGATGADTGGKLWGESEGIRTVEYKARWEVEGRAAGPLRNQRMLADGDPDIAICFPGGKGTANMTKLLEGAGIPIIKVGEFKL